MKCVEKVKELDVECPCNKCRFWIEHKQDNNCCFIAIENNKKMSFAEVGRRLGISPAGVKFIEDKALRKISKTNALPTIYE